MRVGLLAPISWRVPPRHYGPWEQVVALIAEGLVARGVDVTLFATADSQTSARLVSVCPRPLSEDDTLDPKVWECLHIANAFEHAGEFDLLHNHLDFLPLSYSGLVRTPLLTTIHGFSSTRILPVYQRYNWRSRYVAISNADRSLDLDYIATVYHGIDLTQFTFQPRPGDYLLFMGRIHPDKGAAEAIEVARRTGRRLVMAGIIHDHDYYERLIAPQIDGDQVTYLGSVGPGERDRLLGDAAAFLHLINFDEPFGLSMVEAMACGTPVIAIGRGSVPELIRDRETGLIVHSVDEAVRAVPVAIRLDRAAIHRYAAERFSADRMVDDYLRVYETMLAQPQ